MNKSIKKFALIPGEKVSLPAGHVARGVVNVLGTPYLMAEVYSPQQPGPAWDYGVSCLHTDEPGPVDAMYVGTLSEPLSAEMFHYFLRRVN